MDKDGSQSQEMKQASDSMIGRVLDRYKILGKLGEGGMGEVYEVEHVRIQKRFALKLLRQEIVTNEEAVRRFEQEAKSAASIGHKNIVDITDSGEMDDGRVFLVMEKLKGTPLNDLIERPQSDQRLLNILIQTCHGLAAAHKKEIVHRDMKPENIFVVQNQGLDVPKILDFGIAKVSGADGANNLTRTGAIFGTPFYMAPEQALGQQVDHRADVYAIGVIMFEMFCGQVPFDGESFMGILTQHITSEPPNPKEIATANQRVLPNGLDIVIKKAMSKEADDRYQSMDALVNSLVMIYRSVEGSGMSSYISSDTVAVSNRNDSSNDLSSSASIGTSSQSRSPSRPSVITDSAYLDEIEDSYKPSNRLKWIGLALPLLLIGGGAFYFFGMGKNKDVATIKRESQKPLVIEKDKPIAEDTMPAFSEGSAKRGDAVGQEATSGPQGMKGPSGEERGANEENPAEGKDVESQNALMVPVLISSIPPKAEIYIGGVKSEFLTPHVFPVDPNAPLSVEVKKRGYVSESLELNGDIPKPFVKLQRVKKKGNVNKPIQASTTPKVPKKTKKPEKKTEEKKKPAKDIKSGKRVNFCKKNPKSDRCLGDLLE